MKMFSFVILLLTVLVLMSFSTNTHKQTRVYTKPTQVSIKAYYVKQCTFCHRTNGKVAPQMQKIKKVYKQKFPASEDFIEALSGFVIKPSPQKRIFPDKSYETMPENMFHNDQKIKAVALYIYNNSNL